MKSTPNLTKEDLKSLARLGGLRMHFENQIREAQEKLELVNETEKRLRELIERKEST